MPHNLRTLRHLLDMSEGDFRVYQRTTSNSGRARLRREGHRRLRKAVKLSEELSPRERALETVVVQLRRSDGIDRAAFRQQTGIVLDAIIGTVLSRLVELGLMSDNGSWVALSRQGKCVADSVVQEVMKAAPCKASTN